MTGLATERFSNHVDLFRFSGMYNYVYGVTNVPLLDFCGGIFLGSLKPYLLDSYLGFFGKELVEGSSDAAGIQDVVLLVALGVSVMIGVFASQLASETYDSVLEEIEAENKAKREEAGEDEDDGITREFLGIQLPDWVVNFQYTLKDAEASVQEMIDIEFEAQVWNYTDTNDEGVLLVPADVDDPARRKEAPEISEANQGIDFGFGLSESLMLSPLLFSTFFKAVDPYYNPEEDEEFQDRKGGRLKASIPNEIGARRDALLGRIQAVESKTNERIKLLDEIIEEKEKR